MAQQAPYNPVPQVGQQLAPTPNLRVNTPLEAFGGATAHALGNVGAALDKVGNELFNRAYALQELNNQAEARDATTKYIIDAGELHAQFSSLQGDAAAKALPDHMRELQEARNKIRDGLTNPMAQKMFDAESQSTMGRTIFNAAGHAAAENKNYLKGSAEARIKASEDQVLSTPNDERGFQEGLEVTKKNIEFIGDLKGWGEDQRKQAQIEAKSKLVAKRIEGKARNEPFTANTMLDEAVKKGDLRGEDITKVTNVVQTKGQAVGSANIADGVFADGQETTDRPAKSLETMESEATDKAKKLFPNDPLMPQHAVAALRSRWYIQKQAITAENNTNKNTIEQSINQLPPDMQTLMADPKTAAAVEQLKLRDPKYVNSLPGRLDRMVRSAERQTKEARAVQLNGQRVSDDPDAREEFINLDMTKEPLSKGDMIRFQNQQAKMRQDIQGDPRVQRIMGELRASFGAELQALQIYQRDKNNPEAYDKFVGTLSGAIDTWVEDNKRMPTSKEVKDVLWPRLMQTRTEPYFFGLISSNVQWFNQTIPSESLTATRLAIAKGMAEQGTPVVASEISDEMVRRVWMKAQYIKLYGAGSKPKDQSRAP